MSFRLSTEEELALTRARVNIAENDLRHTRDRARSAVSHLREVCLTVLAQPDLSEQTRRTVQRVLDHPAYQPAPDSPLREPAHLTTQLSAGQITEGTA